VLYFRRFVWFIAKNLLWICALLGMLVCGFYMALNISNIYVILNDGLEKRVDVILTRQEAEELNKYFHADFLIADPALAGALDGSSAYVDYNIKDFEYELTIEKLWAWPWDVYATAPSLSVFPKSKAASFPAERAKYPKRSPIGRAVATISPS